MEPVSDEDVVEEVHRVHLAQGDGEGLVRELLSADDPLGKRFGEADNDQSGAAYPDFIQDFRAHGDVRVLRDLLLIRHARRSGEEQGNVLAQKLLQIVEEVRGTFLIVQHEQVRTS